MKSPDKSHLKPVQLKINRVEIKIWDFHNVGVVDLFSFSTVFPYPKLLKA